MTKRIDKQGMAHGPLLYAAIGTLVTATLGCGGTSNTGSATTENGGAAGSAGAGILHQPGAGARPEGGGGGTTSPHMGGNAGNSAGGHQAESDSGRGGASGDRGQGGDAPNSGAGQAGGMQAGTGGLVAGAGGDTAGLGGAAPGAGGLATAAGGLAAGGDGVAAGAGGVAAGAGGVAAGAGGVAAGAGGVAAGAGGVAAGAGGMATDGGAGNGGGADEVGGSGGATSVPPGGPFCGSLLELENLNPDLVFDHLVIECLVLTDLMFERGTIHARVLEIRDQGVTYEGDYCLYPSVPDLWLEATESVTVGAPISLRGQDGRTGTDYGDDCGGFGVGGGSVSIIAPEIVIDATINTKGGDGQLAAVTNVQFETDGGPGGTIALSASESVTLTEQAELDFAGGDPSPPGEFLDGVPGEPGTLLIQTPELYDQTQDPWNRQWNVAPTLAGSTTVSGSSGSLSSGIWFVTLPSGESDFIEEVFLLEVSTVPVDVRLEVSSAAVEANFDLDLVGIEGTNIVTLGESAGPTSSEEVEATLTTAGTYYIMLNRSQEDSGGPDPVNFTLVVEVP